MNDPVTVACLAGDGVGPELMAAATRAPVTSRICTRWSSTSSTCRTRVRRLRVRATRCRPRHASGTATSTRSSSRPPTSRPSPVSRPTSSSPGGSPACTWVSGRTWWRSRRSARGPTRPRSSTHSPAPPLAGRASPRSARARTGTRSSSAAGAAIRGSGWSGSGLGEAVIRLKERPEEIDVVVTEAHLLDALVEAASHFAGSKASVAHGWMPERGPGVFAPGESESYHLGGFDAADPTGMLLTVPLLLGRGAQAARCLTDVRACRRRSSGPQPLGAA